MNRSKLEFLNAKATNTRLMGVVGLVCEWEDDQNRRITQIFHLDYEAYGIDGFYHFMEGDPKEIQNTILGVTGGLGGSFVDINYEEFVFLIKSAYIIDPESIESLVDFEYFKLDFESLYTGLTTDEEVRLYQRLCPAIENEITLLNYFIMRNVGCDYPSTMLLWHEGLIDDGFEIVEEPYSLLKNTSTCLSESGQRVIYRCEALIDFEAHYKIVIVEVELDRSAMKVVKARVVESLEISSIEASFNLNRPEHMMILTIEDAFFERRFHDQNPEMMRYDYYNGRLYSEFNTHNDHVGENPYYLNGDLFALYFFTSDGQLIVGALSQEALEAVDHTFMTNHVYEDSMQFICEVKTDHPVLYSFMNSAYDNIFDFLENWRG
ncbi:hypothetical protein [Fusibacter ferrireducens]|uniref:Uncharacterized protein n=1 Tax=Fusibacter ferrireducens TaxID=2785058 RepID=A0ABR9ZVN5_9FIRM|nr:hypothetical protein [Fusibacter ferrireducens]MBF4694522.1 hypothetical protein [Fusibacter ferrireducens]